MKLKGTASQQESTMVRNSLTIEKNRTLIRQLTIEGRSVEYIAKQIGVGTHALSSKYLSALTANVKLHRADLGHKNEPYYFTEEEMLNEVKYDYNTLSDEEKQIYNERQEASELGRYFASDDGFYGGPSNYLSCGL